MSLKFPGKWRFEPPPDADFITSEIPEVAIDDFIEMVNKLAPQADRWDTLELFKSHFRQAAGSTHLRSSALFFAEQDLRRDASAAAKNAPLFIEAFFDACRVFEGEREDRYAPDEAMINRVLVKHGIGLEIRGERLVRRGDEPELVAVEAAAPTLAEKAAQLTNSRVVAESNDYVAGVRGTSGCSGEPVATRDGVHGIQGDGDVNRIDPGGATSIKSYASCAMHIGVEHSTGFWTGQRTCTVTFHLLPVVA